MCCFLYSVIALTPQIPASVAYWFSCSISSTVCFINFTFVFVWIIDKISFFFSFCYYMLLQGSALLSSQRENASTCFLLWNTVWGSTWVLVSWWEGILSYVHVMLHFQNFRMFHCKLYISVHIRVRSTYLGNVSHSHKEFPEG